MLAIHQCPICEGRSFTPFLSCVDHTVSHETFNLTRCSSCDFIVTTPRPDEAALSKYYVSSDYISHSNTSTTLVDKIYQISRYLSLNWKIKLISNLAGKSTNVKLQIMDYGCGTGEFLKRAKDSDYNITGVEPSAIARDQATKLTGVTIHESVNSVTDSFDVITLWHVLEHIPDLNKIIDQLKDRLTKNGIIFIAVPNHKSLDASYYQQHWAAFDVPRHLWHFSQSTMKMLLAKHGLRLEKTIPMKLDSFYVCMLSEKYRYKKNTLAGMTKAFLNGLRSNLKGSNTSEYSSLIYIARK